MKKRAILIGGMCAAAILAHGTFAGAQTDTPAPDAGPVLYTLTVSQVTNGGLPGKITSTPKASDNPNAIDNFCSLETCVAKFPAGTSVRLNLDITKIREFDWSDACKGTSSNTCTIKMDADKTATVTLAPVNHRGH